MKIIIVGAGKVGSRVAKALSSEKHDVIVIDTGDEALRNLSGKADVLTMQGNGADPETLKEAGVKGADYVMAVTRNDDQNIICCLIAKSLGAKRTIARVRDTLYAKQSDFLTSNLGIDVLINPEKETAEHIARYLRYPGAKSVECISGRTEIVGVKIDPESPLAGKMVWEIPDEYKLKFLVCAVERNDEVIIPNGQLKLESGDIAYFTGARPSLFALMRKFGHGNKASDVMIIGASRIGRYLSSGLTENGFRVKLIEQDREKCEELVEEQPKLNVICGNGASRSLLIEEGIDDMSAFVGLTGNDEVNTINAIFCERRGIESVITKLSGKDMDEFTDELGLGTIVCPAEIVSEELIKITRGLKGSGEDSEIESLYKIIDDSVEAVTFLVKNDCELVGKSIKDLKIKPEVLVAGITRGREYIIPDGNTQFTEGDEILVVSAKYQFTKASDILL